MMIIIKINGSGLISGDHEGSEKIVLDLNYFGSLGSGFDDIFCLTLIIWVMVLILNGSTNYDTKTLL